MIFSSVPVYFVFIAWKKKPKPIQRTLGKDSHTLFPTRGHLSLLDMDTSSP
jgi:hypothetical protein